VLSCDSFTTLPPTDLFSFHATQNSSATAVFFDSSQNEDLVNLKLKGGHLTSRLIVENDSSLYIGYEKKLHRLLFVKSAIDVHETLGIRTSLLWRYRLSSNLPNIRYPHMNLSATLQDAHIYIFKRWVKDLICKNKNISSLKSDLLPVLVKMQWQSNLRKKEGLDERISRLQAILRISSFATITQSIFISHFIK
jgi:translation initiation factor eIF-2B subunit gamma